MLSGLKTSFSILFRLRPGERSISQLILTAIIGLLLVTCGTVSTPAGPTALPATVKPPTKVPATPTAEEAAMADEPVGRWIEVLLDEQKVLLHDGDTIVAEYLVAAGVGTSPETTTFPGEFEVRAMWPGPDETVPGVFVTHIVVFDWAHGNGFHSLPFDEDGNILDPTLGKPASAGCVRLANAAELYEFAELGMPVVIRE